MAVSHITLLQYLGKNITFKYPCPLHYDSLGFSHLSGKVISVSIELDQKHQLCVLFDESIDHADYFYYDKIIELKVLDDRSIVDAALTGLITDNKDFIDSLSK